MLIPFSEIGASLKRNKLRTALTGFSISWGIFMLIILLSAGNGLKNSSMDNFAQDNKNRVYISAGATSIPYMGKPKNTPIRMDNSDSVFVANCFAEVDQVVPVFRVGYKEISTQTNYVSSNIQAVIPEYFDIDEIDILHGRNINKLDIRESRKVIVLSERDAVSLFKDESPISRYTVIDGIPFQVIGVYKKENTWQTNAFIPLSTAQTVYNSRSMREMVVTVNGLNTIKANEAFNDKVVKRMSLRHLFDPSDKWAIYVWNQMENYLQSVKLFNAIDIFIWAIGLGTLIAGIVGVSNIMLITVRERTKEIGIRKAIGAKPNSIITMIVTEALIITSLFGYIGMICGIMVTEVISNILAKSGASNIPIKDPGVDMGIVLAATAILVIAGTLAGYFPARKAVRVKPIEALRNE